MKPSCIHTRRNHISATHFKTPITGILMISLLTGAGDHQIRVGKRQFLRINATTDGVGLLDLLTITACCKQTAQLFASQGVTGKHQGQAETSTHQGPDIAGIGVVGMNPVRTPIRSLQLKHQLIRQLIEMGPKLLLTQIAFWTKTEAANARPGSNRFLRPGVIRRHATVLNQTSDHFNVINLSARRETSNKFENIKGLTTRVSIPSKLQIMGTEQTMEMKMKKLQSHIHPPQQTGKSPDGLING